MQRRQLRPVDVQCTKTHFSARFLVVDWQPAVLLPFLYPGVA
jgi:hypothetical protein